MLGIEEYEVYFNRTYRHLRCLGKTLSDTILANGELQTKNRHKSGTIRIAKRKRLYDVTRKALIYLVELERIELTAS